MSKFLFAIIIFTAGTAQGASIVIELTPTDVGSSSASEFSTLPTVDPGLFGLTGADVRSVNFDFFLDSSPISSGTALTNEFATIGVEMNNILVSNSVFEGAASDPNATFFDSGHTFNFSVPVVAVGLINTSPDQDRVQLWSGANGTGTLLLDFNDQDGLTKNFHIDRFVGGRVTGGGTIGSMLVFNETGNLELDELIFEVVPLPAAVWLFASALAGLSSLRRKQAA